MLLSENQIVRNILLRAKRLWRGNYAWWVRTHGSQYGKKGVPDLLFCVRGRFVAIEFKTATGRVSKIQHGQLKQIAQAGGVAAVSCTADDAQKIIEGIIHGDDDCLRKECSCPCHEKSEVLYEREKFKREVERTLRPEGEEEIALDRIGIDQIDL